MIFAVHGWAWYKLKSLSNEHLHKVNNKLFTHTHTEKVWLLFTNLSIRSYMHTSLSFLSIHLSFIFYHPFSFLPSIISFSYHHSFSPSLSLFLSSIINSPIYPSFLLYLSFFHSFIFYLFSYIHPCILPAFYALIHPSFFPFLLINPLIFLLFPFLPILFHPSIFLSLSINLSIQYRPILYTISALTWLKEAQK